MDKNTLSLKPNQAALVGILFALPFLILNGVISQRIEPLFTLIRPGKHTSPLEIVLLTIIILLFPTGAFISALPIYRKKKFYPINIFAALALLAIFFMLSTVLLSELYRCD